MRYCHIWVETAALLLEVLTVWSGKDVEKIWNLKLWNCKQEEIPPTWWLFWKVGKWNEGENYWGYHKNKKYMTV